MDKEASSGQEELEEKNSRKILDKIQMGISSWKSLATFKTEDSVWLMVLKILLQIIGILLLILLSPIALLGLILAFFAAL